jgi:predicted enzyme related to lactoylglutathione lyase
MGRPIQIDIDCTDPEALAAFWAEVLSYKVADPPGGHESWAEFSGAEAEEPDEMWCALFDPDRRGPPLLFHRVRESKVVKNRLHIDVWVAPRGGDPETNWTLVDAEVDRLVELGATKIRRVSDNDQCFVVMTDPEGNEFCVCG